MAKKKRRLKTKEEEEFLVLDELFTTLSNRIDKIPVGKGKKAVITWSIVAVILMAASSVLFHFNWVGTWIPAIIGAPAGLILYLMGLGLVKRTQMGEWSLFNLRETRSFKNRLKLIAIWFAVYVVVFIAVSQFISVPYGVGGAVLITLFMTSLAVARRTSYELELAKQGLPDPRDLQDLEDQDDYAEEVEETIIEKDQPDADKIYYDEQRGGFGGKLK